MSEVLAFARFLSNWDFSQQRGLYHFKVETFTHPFSQYWSKVKVTSQNIAVFATYVPTS